MKTEFYIPPMEGEIVPVKDEEYVNFVNKAFNALKERKVDVYSPYVDGTEMENIGFDFKGYMIDIVFDDPEFNEGIAFYKKGSKLSFGSSFDSIKDELFDVYKNRKNPKVSKSTERMISKGIEIFEKYKKNLRI